MTRCARCPGVNNCVPPSGPRGELLFVGEAPGKEENKKREVFIGKTGREVNEHYLPLAGLRRESVRFVNAIRCLPVSAGGKLDPKRKADLDLLGSCANTFLLPEIADNPQLKLTIPMGAFACKALDPNINLELHHGRPYLTRDGVLTFPMYHPAGGLHEPKKMLLIRTDWIRLRDYLRGKLHIPVDSYPNPDYQEVTDADEIYALDPTLPLGLDTESSRRRGPYCLTYSALAGTGRLIRAERRHLLEAFQRHIEKATAPLIFHNWLYDKPITQQLGLRLPDRRIRDTMVRAFHLGNLSQALKVSAFRELGMTMQDFVDVVGPHSQARVLDYYRRAQDITWPKPEPEMVRDEGKWKLYKPQGMNTKLKRFFTDFGKNPEKDVFGMWDNWEDSWAMLEEQLGPWPGMDIDHAPFEDVLHYACRDADATLRFWFLLCAMRRRVRKLPQERWAA